LKRIAGNPYLTIDENGIWVDRVNINEILPIFGTPTMILMENRLRENIHIFNDVFYSVFKNCEVFYSSKANYLPEICKIIKSERIGVEIVGEPELELVLKMNFPSQQIIAGGPYLTEKFIERCIKNHIKEIIIYHLDDIKRVEQVARNLKEDQGICLRVNSNKYGSKLGITLNISNLQRLKTILNDSKHVVLKTILSHYGTQMNSIIQFEKNCMNIIDAILALNDKGIKIENINFGGGFPEATIMPRNQLDRIARSLKEKLDDSGINYSRVYFEPGRFLVGDSGIFLAEIANVLEDRWILINIGTNICPSFARSSLRFYNLTRIEDPHKIKTSIGGIVPTDQDVFVKDYFFTEKLTKGDKIMITNVGAYCLTFSNRFPYSLPHILMITDNTFKRIFDPLIEHDISLK
jgi:diaminopimelate decarboxylase